MTKHKGKTCEVEGCNRDDIKARGLCNKHYARWQRGAPLTGDRRRGRRGMSERIKTRTSKRCHICKQVKGPDDFYRTPKGYWQSGCKQCRHNKKAAEWQEFLRERGPLPPRQPRKMPKCIGPCDRTAEVYFKNIKSEPYCAAHYNQRWAGKELTPVHTYKKSYINDSVRQCTACERILPVDEFHKRTNGTRQGRCRKCYTQAVRFRLMLREDRLEEAVSITESMCEFLKNKYVPLVVTALNQREFERSNERLRTMANEWQDIAEAEMEEEEIDEQFDSIVEGLGDLND